MSISSQKDIKAAQKSIINASSTTAEKSQITDSKIRTPKSNV